MTGSILVVDDEPAILELVEHHLIQAGLRVLKATTGPAAVALALGEQPDLIVLDLLLPDMDGFAVCRAIRRQSGVPILMLTARNDEIDRVCGLELGADDYLSKPFSPRELVARIRAILRRGGSGPPDGRVVAGPLLLDTRSHSAILGQEPLHLTPTEFTLLLTLAGDPGRVFRRAELLGAMWGQTPATGSRNVDVYVRYLREKLGAYAGLIETVRGVGYRFAAPDAWP